jgi:hypothetical protein
MKYIEFLSRLERAAHRLSVIGFQFSHLLSYFRPLSFSEEAKCLYRVQLPTHMRRLAALCVLCAALKMSSTKKKIVVNSREER